MGRYAKLGGIRSAAAGIVAVAMLAVAAPATSGATEPADPSDFNGDGYADLAIGVPNEGFDRKFDAGVVQVLYGGAGGLSARGDQLWSQDSPGVKGIARRADSFGSAIASGDFDRDGFADLAIGAPADNADGFYRGAVNILFGSATGLTATGDEFWTAASIASIATVAEGLGENLEAGDFDGDGYWDLAISVDTLSTSPNFAGAVVVLRGGVSGLTLDDGLVIAEGAAGVPGEAEENATFGFAMAAGDIDGDGFEDLAVGAPNGTVNGQAEAGRAVVVYGTSNGLDLASAQSWSQDSPDVADQAEFDGCDDSGCWSEQFGYALAMGDYNADGFEDVAFGVPGERVAALGEGAVSVLHGSADGLTATGNQLWLQDTPGVPGTGEPRDRFGGALASGRFDDNATNDLAIAATHETVGATRSAGAVVILHGTTVGLGTGGAQLWTQNTDGVPGVAERGDVFGLSLESANFGHSANDDLAVGVPVEGLGSISAAGEVTVFYGRTSGVTTADIERWSQRTTGVKGTAEQEDLFGWATSP